MDNVFKELTEKFPLPRTMVWSLSAAKTLFKNQVYWDVNEGDEDK